MKKWIRYFLGTMILSLAFCVHNGHAQFFDAANPLIGSEAVDFTLPDVSGDKVVMSQFRQGKDAIIFFWATWCPHCRTQITTLNSRSADLEKNGIKVLLVDLGEDAGMVSAYLEKNNIKFPAVLDHDYSASDQYGVAGVPTLVFIDKNGVVKGVENYLPEDYMQMFAQK